MILFITGVLLIALGLFSGAALVAYGLGALADGGGMALWVLFPTLSLAGLTVVGMAARSSGLHGLGLFVSLSLLVLALAAGAGLVASAAGLMAPPVSAMALWYVLVLAGLAGLSGAATMGRIGAKD